MLDISIDEWKILLMAMIPFSELRLAIPFGVMIGLAPFKTLILACIGNFLPIIPILLLLEPMSRLISKIPKLFKYYNKFINKTRSKGAKVEKYGALGLLLFVAIPLPGTGIYSGTVLAFLLGIRFWYSLISLTLGMIIAGIAVTLASTGFKELTYIIYDFEYIVIGLILLAIAIFLIKRYKK